MQILTSKNTAKVSLVAHWQLTVFMSANSEALVVWQDGTSEQIGKRTLVASEWAVFGPFPADTTFELVCMSGSLSYDSSLDMTVATLENGAVMPQLPGFGLKVDLQNPTFGWRDLTSAIDLRGVGANDPTFAVYTGTTMRAYSFSAGTMQEVFFVFHVPHDWVPGTDIFLHAHWSNAAAAPNTGNVVWGFDYSFAKGFGQEAFPAIQTAQVIAASPATRYIHNVSETTAVTIPTMEVDGLILMRAFRDAANVLDTCSDAVFLHTIDIHYQSTNMATKNKAPSFYGELA